MLKRAVWLFLILFCISCDFVDNTTQGDLSLNVSSDGTRMFLPDVDMTIDYYLVTGSGPNGGFFQKRFHRLENQVIPGLLFGSWTLTAEGYNRENFLLGRGASSVEIRTGMTTSALITLKPVEGAGSLSLKATWNPLDFQGLASVETRLNSFGAVTKNLDFTVDQGLGLAESLTESVSSGYHTLQIRLLDSGVPVRGTVDIVRILHGAETRGEWNFTQINKIEGGTGPIVNPIDITLKGQKDKLFPHESMSVTASVPEGTGEVIFIWYLNGERKHTGTAYTFSWEDLPAGFHDLSVTAFLADGSRAGIARHSFRNMPWVPSVSWQKIYGGFNFDMAYKIIQTNDGGYLIGGASNSTRITGCTNQGGYDAYLVKVNYLGEIEWQKMFGGSGNDEIKGLTLSKDGTYIVAGTTSSPFFSGKKTFGGEDQFVVKLDLQGNFLWKRVYGTPGFESVESLNYAGDDCFILAGSSSAYYLCDDCDEDDWDDDDLDDDCYYDCDDDDCDDHDDHDDDCDDEFRDCKDDCDDDDCDDDCDDHCELNCTIQCHDCDDDCDDCNDPSDKGRVDKDFLLMKISSEGEMIWASQFGGSGSDEAYSVVSTSDGGFVVAGSSESTDIPGTVNSGRSDFMVVKTDSNGKALWTGLYGRYSWEVACSIQQTSEGNLVIAGSTSSGTTSDTDRYRDVYLVKITSSGEFLWEKHYGGSMDDSALSVKQTHDGGFIIAGHSASSDLGGTTSIGWYDAYLLKLDSQGDPEWQRTFGGISEDRSFDVIQSSDKGYAVAGYTYPPGPGEFIGCYDFYVLKLNSQGQIE